jgi:hypothetical protein
MTGIVKHRRIVPVGAALCAVVALALAPARCPVPAHPEKVVGGRGSLYCTLAWIFVCHAQPGCRPHGCYVTLFGQDYF